MPKVTLQPARRSVRVGAGTTVLEAHIKAGLPPISDCGGLGTCGRCRVRYLSEPPGPSPTEEGVLTRLELQAGYRLACLSKVYTDASVEVAFTELGRTYKELAFFGERTAPLEPSVRRIRLPSGGGADMERVLFDGEVLVERPACHRPLLGVALDIGTTTMAGYLMDLGSGEEKAALGLRNPQAAYGADVITRIDAACRRAGGLRALQSLCLSGLKRLVEQLLSHGGYSRQDIFHAVMVGNPTMVHFFLGVDPSPISYSPFEPVFKERRILHASGLTLGLPEYARVETLPAVSGYVGADTVAMALFLGLDQRKETCLALDVGTNGEMLLSVGGRIYACSTAAGPAFEGGRITCGIRAQRGAIDRFIWNGHEQALSYRVLGGGRPRGISGSGLVSLINLLLDRGVIIPSGRFASANAVPSSLARRLRQGERQMELLLVDGKHAARGQELVLTQRDIRELQLAKGAMAAGMRRLLDHAGIGVSQLDRIYLAGSFGTSLDPRAAQRIGLLPPVPLEKVVAVGNAAGAGARMVLCSRTMRETADRLAESIAYLELSSDARFSDWFPDAMPFPRGDQGAESEAW